MRIKKWWIKERHNPQLGIYYVGCGQLSEPAARRKERPLYGSNIMHGFDTKAEYEARLVELVPRWNESRCIYVAHGVDGKGAQVLEAVTADVYDAEVARLKEEAATDTAQIVLLTDRIADLERENATLKASLYTCPSCAFTFLRIHDDADGSGRFSCPSCAETALEAEIEAQGLIDREKVEQLESENAVKESALVEWEKYRLFIPLAKGLIARIFEADSSCDPPTDIGLRLESIIRKRDELREQLRKAEGERERLFDLVRLARHELHVDGAINDEEYAILADDAASLRRLESFAKVERRYSALRSAIAPFVEVARRAVTENRISLFFEMTQSDIVISQEQCRAVVATYDAGDVREEVEVKEVDHA